MIQVFIIGFGRYGKLALTQGTRRWRKARFWIIDSRPEALITPLYRTSPVIRILADGPLFLTRFQKWIGDKDLIIPALPVHLAWRWLVLNLKPAKALTPSPPPENLGSDLPFHQSDGKGLYLSYADFLCPEKCPSPLRYCYKTKIKRDIPLWKFITDLQVPKGSMGVIESRQLAPGVGGYVFGELRKIRDLARKSTPPFFVATACRCHGVIHGMTWEKRGGP